MSTEKLLIAVTSLAILEAAIITLLTCSHFKWMNATEQWKKAAKELHDHNVEFAAQVKPLKEQAEFIKDKYVAKDRECERLRGEKSAINARYEELIMAVASKFDREERHDTALRYIKEREAGPSTPNMEAKLGR